MSSLAKGSGCQQITVRTLHHLILAGKEPGDNRVGGHGVSLVFSSSREQTDVDKCLCSYLALVY